MYYTLVRVWEELLVRNNINYTYHNLYWILFQNAYHKNSEN